MKNEDFLNKDAIERLLRTHKDREKMLLKLDKSISYWKNYVRKTA